MSEITEQEAAAAVDAVLKAHRLPVTEEERASLIRTYPQIVKMTNSLRIPEARYGEPALRYSAAYPSAGPT